MLPPLPPLVGFKGQMLFSFFFFANHAIVFAHDARCIYATNALAGFLFEEFSGGKLGKYKEAFIETSFKKNIHPCLIVLKYTFTEKQLKQEHREN